MSGFFASLVQRVLQPGAAIEPVLPGRFEGGRARANDGAPFARESLEPMEVDAPPTSEPGHPEPVSRGREAVRPLLDRKGPDGQGQVADRENDAAVRRAASALAPSPGGETATVGATLPLGSSEADAALAPSWEGPSASRRLPLSGDPQAAAQLVEAAPGVRQSAPAAQGMERAAGPASALRRGELAVVPATDVSARALMPAVAELESLASRPGTAAFEARTSPASRGEQASFRPMLPEGATFDDVGSSAANSVVSTPVARNAGAAVARWVAMQGPTDARDASQLAVGSEGDLVPRRLGLDSSPPVQPPPSVRVSVGRIEVRAPPAARAPRSAPPGFVSLSEYLKRGSG